jgi:hypothetical protein
MTKQTRLARIGHHRTSDRLHTVPMERIDCYYVFPSVHEIQSRFGVIKIRGYGSSYFKISIAPDELTAVSHGNSSAIATRASRK